MLKTKCIKAPRSPNDGIRISTMRGYKENDGIYNEWLYNITPHYMVEAYYKNGMPWKEFEKGFVEHLKKPSVQGYLRRLIEVAHNVDVTILCVAEDTEKSHRRLIAEMCANMDPELDIEIK